MWDFSSMFHIGSPLLYNFSLKMKGRKLSVSSCKSANRFNQEEFEPITVIRLLDEMRQIRCNECEKDRVTYKYVKCMAARQKFHRGFWA